MKIAFAGTPDFAVPALDALDKKCAGDFVRAREGYSWAFLKRDYDAVARLASPEVFAPFQALYYPQIGKGRQQAWAKGQEHVITIVSRRLTGPASSSTEHAELRSSLTSRRFRVDRERRAPAATMKSYSSCRWFP